MTSHEKDFVAESGVLNDPPDVSPESGAPLNFPPAQPESVLGPHDDRKQVDNSLVKPFRWVGQLFAVSNRFPNGPKAVGTAFVIGKQHLLTAAHNLHVGSELADFFEFYPALSGDRSAPTLGKIVVRHATAHPQFSDDSAGAAFDIAVLRMDQPLPTDLASSEHDYGALPIVQSTVDQLNGLRAFVTGYPKSYPEHDRDRFPRPDAGTQAFQYYCVSRMRKHGRLVSYDLDTTGGQSGSPLITLHKRSSDGQEVSVAVGVHIEGGDESTGNLAVPLDASRMNFVSQTVSETGGESHLA